VIIIIDYRGYKLNFIGVMCYGLQSLEVIRFIVIIEL
jgi:hypothetical protein